MRDPWDWTGSTTYQFRVKRIRDRFRYRFVRELFDLTMKQAIAFLKTRGREMDHIFGIDSTRTEYVARITEVFRKAGEHGVVKPSDFVDQVSRRERACEFIDRAGITLDDLKATLVEIDCVILPFQKSLRLLVPKSDKARNRHIDKLVEQKIGNNLTLLDSSRTAADREKLSRRTGIPPEALLDLVHRADMARQHCMARTVDAFYAAGYDTMEKFRAADLEAARAAGVDLGRVIYARTRPRVVEDVPQLQMPPLPQVKAKPRSAGCGNNCSPCTGPYGCVFEKCVSHNRVPICAHCSAFPCDAHDDGGPASDLEKLRGKLKPEEIVPIRPLSPERPLIVDFPDQTRLPAKDKAALRHVHHLLVAARQVTSGSSYAQRLRMDFTRRHVFDVLWCIAHHGEFVLKPAPHLYLRKGTCKEKGQRMPDPHALVFERLALPGVTVEETRSPAIGARRVADDECRLFLDTSAGGRDALRMLRRFADALCQQYGEPESGRATAAGRAKRTNASSPLT